MRIHNAKLKLVVMKKDKNQNEVPVNPVCNYTYLQFWSHFNWELYVKILKAKFI